MSTIIFADTFYFTFTVRYSPLRFIRVCFYFADSKNNPHRLCMAVYYLPENFNPKPVAHGNSKEDKPFFSTLPSTMARIKHECSDAKGLKKVVQEVSNTYGGVLSATDICQLPRGEQQVSQAKRRCKQSSISQAGSADDELQQCFIRHLWKIPQNALSERLKRYVNRQLLSQQISK